MRKFDVPFWKPIPFLRLLIPLTAGILFENYMGMSRFMIALFLALSLAVYGVIKCLPTQQKYRYRWVTGLVWNLLFFILGIFLLQLNDNSKQHDWIGNKIAKSSSVLVMLDDIPIRKGNSLKVVSTASYLLINNKWELVKGKVLLYFDLQTNADQLRYGTQISISKQLQPIKNLGNPGEFDYQSFAARKGMHYQVYLQVKDYTVWKKSIANPLQEKLIQTRTFVLATLKKKIPGTKESGVAEALLIGYREDLDKELVQSYSNTGVVHIIAISGLHLGMIYGLLIFCLKPFKKKKWIWFVKPVLIIAVLWGFSLLTGAAASILRSAVMFTFIVVGDSLGRKTNIYNTLAASAFCLLCYNPYLLWDPGFQLSYTAVSSIIIFMKPIYKQIYCTNKLLDAIWQLNAVTLSAQILTLPLILYYFHRFPNYFLFTNFIAVPLSGFILYAELLLISFSGCPFINTFLGKLVSGTIHWMNGLIERTSILPYAVTENIQITLLQTFILFSIIGFIAWWLFRKDKSGLAIGLGGLTLFFLIYCIHKMDQKKQHTMIIYQIPKYTGIDILKNDQSRFAGDLEIASQKALQLRYLQPTRYHMGALKTHTPELFTQALHIIREGHKTILVVRKGFKIPPIKERIKVDIMLISHQPKIRLSALAAAFDCKLYVFDGSNAMWKIRYLKKEADSLHLRHYSSAEKGALVLEL